MCSVYKSATFATLFSVIKFNINTIILQDMELDTFAQKLRFLRLERNLNQRELANLLNRGFTLYVIANKQIEYPKQKL